METDTLAELASSFRDPLSPILSPPIRPPEECLRTQLVPLSLCCSPGHTDRNRGSRRRQHPDTCSKVPTQLGVETDITRPPGARSAAGLRSQTSRPIHLVHPRHPVQRLGYEPPKTVMWLKYRTRKTTSRKWGFITSPAWTTVLQTPVYSAAFKTGLLRQPTPGCWHAAVTVATWTGSSLPFRGLPSTSPDRKPQEDKDPVSRKDISKLSPSSLSSPTTSSSTLPSSTPSSSPFVVFCHPPPPPSGRMWRTSVTKAVDIGTWTVQITLL